MVITVNWAIVKECQTSNMFQSLVYKVQKLFQRQIVLIETYRRISLSLGRPRRTNPSIRQGQRKLLHQGATPTLRVSLSGLHRQGLHRALPAQELAKVFDSLRAANPL